MEQGRIEGWQRRLHAGGLTCEEVAEALGVSFGTVKGWLFPDGYLAAQERRKAPVRERREAERG